MLAFSDQRHRTPPRLATTRKPPRPRQQSITAHLQGCGCAECSIDWPPYIAMAVGTVPLIAYDVLVRGGAGILAAIGWQ